MMLRPQRAISLIVLCTMLCIRTAAADDNSDLIRRAYALQAHGDYAGSIAILAPMADSPPADLSEVESGTVWNLLGFSYQTLDNFARSRHCYEKAIAILQGTAPGQDQLASAIDNLGSLEELVGRSPESEHLRKRALSIYAALKDDAGVARVSTNLAVIAARRGDRSAASSYLDQALRYSQTARGLDDDDIASMTSMRGWLALKHGDSQSALAFFQDAIGHWTRLHGADSCQVATGLTLRAQAYERSGDFVHASADLQQAEDIFGARLGKDSTVYWRTVLHHAILMKHEGLGRRAQLLEKSARTALRDIEAQACANCSISVQAFR